MEEVLRREVGEEEEELFELLEELEEEEEEEEELERVEWELKRSGCWKKKGRKT